MTFSRSRRRTPRRRLSVLGSQETRSASELKLTLRSRNRTGLSDTLLGEDAQLDCAFITTLLFTRLATLEKRTRMKLYPFRKLTIYLAWLCLALVPGLDCPALSQGIGADALSDLVKAPEESPVSSAETALKQGNPGQALSFYVRAIQDNPKDASLYLGRGTAYDLLGIDRRAIEDYREAIRLQPDSYRAMENLARILERDTQKIHEALGLYEKAMRLDPRPVWRENLQVWAAMLKSRDKREDSATDLWREGHRALAKGDTPKAEESFTRCASVDPTFFPGFFSRALIRAAAQNPLAALEDYNAGLKLSPYYPEGFMSRGLILESMGDYAGALADFESAVRTEPNNPWAHYHLGRMLERKGHVFAALANYRKSYRLKPKPDLQPLLRTRIEALAPYHQSLVRAGLGRSGAIGNLW